MGIHAVDLEVVSYVLEVSLIVIIMSLIYHRTLLPKFLRRSYPDRDNTKWEIAPKRDGGDLALSIPPDDSDWERVFRIQLVGEDVIRRRDEVTIKLRVGVILPEPKQPRDPMSYMVSDGQFAVGFQIMDPNHDYASTGPYQAVEGDARAVLGNPNVLTNHNIVTNSKRNPNVFDIILKPKERWGSVYCAIDDGHKIVAQFSRELELDRGLFLETYRYKSVEEYTVNFIEVSVYKDNVGVLNS